MKIKDIIQLIKSSFNDLNFIESSHEYYIEREKLPSVSASLTNYKKQFDSYNISRAYAKKHGLDPQEVREEWAKKSNDACILGTRIHSFGERFFYNRNITPEINQEIAIVNYWDSLPKNYKPILCETKVYSKKYSFAGTFDLLIYDTKKRGLIICDYKSNKELFKNFKNEKLLPPFNDLLSNNFNNYSLQLSMYQIPLEEIGLKVIDREIVWLKEDGNFEKFSTIDYTHRLKENINGNRIYNINRCYNTYN